MTGRYTRACLCGIILLIAGCDSGPRIAPGPAPWCGAVETVVRLREKRGSIKTRHEVTFWDEGQGPVEATQRIADLRAAVPEVVRQRLAETRPAVPLKGGTLFDQPICQAQATVVSLSPDVMIVTVRERPPGSCDDLFVEWLFITGIPNIPSDGTEKTDLIAADLGLGFCAGPLLPWSAEMYVVSTDAGVDNGPLKFDGNRAVTALPAGRLVLTRDEDFVSVTRE
jgi:hypothetical protein